METTQTTEATAETTQTAETTETATTQETTAATTESIETATTTDTAETTETTEQTEKTDEKKPEGAPEEYADFTMPENVTVDQPMLDKFKPLARELNLNQDQAQKLVDIAAEMTANHYAQQSEAWQTTQTEWQTAAKADKEYGGDKFEENAEAARRVINTFGTPELKSFLNEYGMGNHPEAVRLFVRISKALKEDTLVVTGGDKSSQGKSLEERMYPNLPKG